MMEFGRSSFNLGPKLNNPKHTCPIFRAKIEQSKARPGPALDRPTLNEANPMES